MIKVNQSDQKSQLIIVAAHKGGVGKSVNSAILADFKGHDLLGCGIEQTGSVFTLLREDPDAFLDSKARVVVIDGEPENSDVYARFAGHGGIKTSLVNLNDSKGSESAMYDLAKTLGALFEEDEETSTPRTYILNTPAAANSKLQGQTLTDVIEICQAFEVEVVCVWVVDETEFSVRSVESSEIMKMADRRIVVINCVDPNEAAWNSPVNPSDPKGQTKGQAVLESVGGGETLNALRLPDNQFLDIWSVFTDAPISHVAAKITAEKPSVIVAQKAATLLRGHAAIARSIFCR